MSSAQQALKKSALRAHCRTALQAATLNFNVVSHCWPAKVQTVHQVAPGNCSVGIYHQSGASKPSNGVSTCTRHVPYQFVYTLCVYTQTESVLQGRTRPTTDQCKTMPEQASKSVTHDHMPIGTTSACQSIMSNNSTARLLLQCCKHAPQPCTACRNAL